VLRAAVAKWWFLVVPAVGLTELGAHFVQVGRTVPEADWARAKPLIARLVQPDDLVIVAPQWAESIARKHFGADVMTLKRIARSDVTGFPRAVEVSFGGRHRDELVGWKLVSEERVGLLSVRLLENPQAPQLREDLVDRIGQPGTTLFRVEANGHADACTWRTGPPQVGNGVPGFGPARPGDRFDCPRGGSAGVTIMPDLDYVARRCVMIPPAGGGTILRLHIPDVRFGALVHGAHGLYAEAEHNLNGPPVTLTFRSGNAILGRATHRDGDAWKGFEFPTPDLADKTADLDIDVQSSGGGRLYCFAADTR
jgi:hypothetical protein